jgi:hypothetical protein
MPGLLQDLRLYQASAAADERRDALFGLKWITAAGPAA